MNSPRFVFCQYADDVRQEIGEKISLIGVYLGGMRIAGVAPVNLPKLAVITHFSTPAEQPFKALNLRILWNGAELQQITLEEQASKQPASMSDIAMQNVQAVLFLQPFRVDASGKLEVIVTVDGEEIRGNPLSVELVSPPNGGPPPAPLQ